MVALAEERKKYKSTSVSKGCLKGHGKMEYENPNT